MRITIKDIAKRLNVHHSTVSRALRMDPRIKHETGEIIRKFAREHGYHININALRLRGGLRNMIAMIVPNINPRFFANIINYMTDLAYENNLVLSIYQSNESFEQECSFIEKLIQQDVAGVIASVSDKTKSSEHFRELNRFRIPLVFFDRVLEDVSASRVTANNREVVELLVSELIKRGCKRIAHISGPDHINVFHERSLGYKNGIKKHGMPYMKPVIMEETFSLESGRKTAAKLFSGKVLPDAVISSSFFLTTSIIRHLKDINLKVPDEVVVAGFGDGLFNSILHPDIISVVQPEEEMASTAFQLLIDQLEYKGEPDRFKYMNIELKSRILYNDR